jgi:hypothetical protein
MGWGKFMKTFLATALACLGLCNATIQASQTADARMYCLSVRFSHGAGPFGLYSLDLTGINSGINGELFPIFGGPRSHYSALILTDEADDEIPGYMYLDVPITDNNGDGFPDFFDTSQPFSGSSSGSFSFPALYNGSASANWQRNAGSHAGTCQLNLQFLGTFTHTFNILEYKGPMTYTPGTNTVSGNVSLALTGVPGTELHAPTTDLKSFSDPYNNLILQPGAWTNATQETFPFFTDTFFRD